MDDLRSIMRALVKVTPIEGVTMEAINVNNLYRIFYLAIVMVVAHSLLIMVFTWHYTYSEYQDKLWHLGIISAHAVMLFIITCLGLASYYLIHRQLAGSQMSKTISEITSLSYLVFGAVVTATDQLVMPATAIIPFLIACMGIAATVIMRPRNSVIQYVTVLILLNISLTLHQKDPQTILSLIVNSFFVVTIALTMSIIRWRSTIVTLEQQRYIEQQNLELEDKNKLLDYSAKHDFLTGLFNRREFIDYAEREIARNSRNANEACGIIIDMDDFKLINDSYGHPTGDLVLQAVATTIKSVLRMIDIPARFGGEEFAVLLPETSEYGGTVVAERIREAIQDLRIRIDSNVIQVTASVGVAALGGAFTSFYKLADQALYQAKAEGRNRVVAAQSLNSEQVTNY